MQRQSRGNTWHVCNIPIPVDLVMTVSEHMVLQAKFHSPATMYNYLQAFCEKKVWHIVWLSLGYIVIMYCP